MVQVGEENDILCEICGNKVKVLGSWWWRVSVLW